MRQSIIFILLSLILTACSQKPADKVSSLYADAVEAMEQQQFDKATSNLDELHAIDSTSPLYDYGYGLMMEYKLMPFDALIYYTRLAKNQPTFDSAYIRQIQIYKELDSPEDIIMTAADYSHFAKNTESIAIMTGYSYFIQHRYDITYNAYRQALLSTKTDSSYYSILMAQVLLRQGKFDSASVYYNRGLTELTPTLNSYEAAADYLIAHGYYDSALVINRQALTRPDANFLTRKNYFKRLLKLQYYADARLMLDSMETSGCDSLVLSGLKLDYAFTHKDQYLVRDASAIYLVYGGKHFSPLLYDMRARGRLHDDLSVEQDMMIVDKYLKREQYTDIFRDYINYYSIRIYYEDGYGLSSKEKLDSLAGTRTNFPTVKMRQLNSWYIKRMADESLQEVKMLNEEHLDDPYWQMQFAEYYSDTIINKSNLAEMSYLRTLRLSKYFPEAMHGYLDLMLRTGNYSKGLTMLENFPEYQANNPSFGIRRAELFYLNGETDQGLETIKNYLPYNSKNISVIQELAQYLYRKDNRDALRSLLSAAGLDSSDNVDLLLLGAIYAFKEQQPEQALEYMKAAIKIEPSNPQAIALYETALYDTGKKDGVFAKLDSLFNKNNTNPHLAYDVSRLMAREHFEMNKAANIARTAVFGTGGNVEYMTNLSYVYYQMGRFDLAKGEAIKAKNIDSTYTPAYLRLAIALAKAGGDENQKDARELLAKAKKIGLWGEWKELADKVSALL